MKKMSYAALDAVTGQSQPTSEELQKLSVADLARLWQSHSPDTRHLVTVGGRFADVKIGRSKNAHRWDKKLLISAIEIDREPNDCLVEIDLGPVQEDKPVAKPKEPTLCHCGCGEAARGKTSCFLPGHDARFYGLIKRVITGKLHKEDSQVTREVREAIQTGRTGHGVFRPLTVSLAGGDVKFTGQPLDLGTIITIAERKEANKK